MSRQEETRLNLEIRAAAWDLVNALSALRRREGLDWSPDMERTYRHSQRLENLLCQALKDSMTPEEQ